MAQGNRPASIPRRRLVTGIAGFVSLAGCLGIGEDSSPPGAETETITADSNDTTTAADEPATSMVTDVEGSDLDVREANVMAVEFDSVATSTYRFDVTLFHDDEGEDGYADWWQVEDLDGDSLGRRELRHAHGTREFTRSERIDVPSGVTCVVVRGHDEIHGYGGRAAVVNLDSGQTEPIDQGAERTAVDSSACP